LSPLPKKKEFRNIKKTPKKPKCALNPNKVKEKISKK
jgi:hypothetical protein